MENYNEVSLTLQHITLWANIFYLLYKDDMHDSDAFP